MPEQGSIIFTWDDFSGGDYGTLGGRKAPANTFKGKNVLVYADGSVGPRAGLKNITPTGMPNGPLLALVATPVPGKDGLFVIAEDVYTFDLNTPSVAPNQIGSFDQAPEQPIVPRPDAAGFIATVRYATDTSDKTYRISPESDLVSPIAASPGGTDAVLYGQQLLVADSQFTPRLFGSDPVDPNDFSEGRFLDIGDNWQITGLFILRNAVAIMKSRGILLLTGILGDEDSEFVRTASTADGALHPWQMAKDQQDKIWFWSLFDEAPAVFNGATVENFGRWELPTRESDDTIADTPLKRGVSVMNGDLTRQTVAFVQGGDSQKAVVNHNGQWTFHDFETGISGLTCPNGKQLILTDGGTNVTPAQIYSTLFNLDRPAFVGEELVSPGDNSNTPIDANFIARQWWSPTGRDVSVRQVVVDFEVWNTGTTETNHFDVNVRVMGIDAARGGNEKLYSTAIDTNPNPYDEATSAASTEGTRKRQVFNFHCAPGSGVEISFTNMRGCAIHSFTVMEAKRDQRPMS